MKFSPEVLAALAILKANAENDFERHRIAVLERDLTEPPQVEIIDSTHQKFNGATYRKTKAGGYISQTILARDIWTYGVGTIPNGFEIHHVDGNKDNNGIANFLCLTKSEHRMVHYATLTGADKIQTLTCEYCGREYETLSRGNSRFCSAKCRRDFKRQKDKEKRICQNCGKEFFADKYSDVICCSCSCGQKLRWKGSIETKICPICGKEFTAYRKFDQKYCSRECAHKFLSESHQEIRICEYCGKEFKIKRSRATRFCSRSCATKNRHAQNKKA